MALIKCPSCGNTISDQASNCPRCGYPINNFGYQNRNDEHPRILRQDSDMRTSYHVQDKKKSNSNIWLYAVITLLSVALLSMGAFIFMNKEKMNNGQGDSTPMAKVVSDVAHASPASAKNKPKSHISKTSAKQELPLAETPTARSSKVSDGTYYLNGAITHKQTYYIDMEVKVRGNQATGRYIVINGENIYVTLSGTIDANGNMKLTEYKSGQPTGYYFTGRFNESIYTGTYNRTNSKLTMDFSVSTY